MFYFFVIVKKKKRKTKQKSMIGKFFLLFWSLLISLHGDILVHFCWE